MTLRSRAAVDGGSPRGRRGPVAWTVASLAVLLAVAPVLLPAPAGGGVGALATAAADPPVVIGDDEGDAYIGFGAFLLPASAPMPAREQAANCFGCQWRLTLACPQADDGPCPGVVAACAADQQWMRVWIADVASSQPPSGSSAAPPTGWVRIAVTCLGPGMPVTVEEMTRRVTQETRAAIPALAPAAEPPSGAVARLPMVFRSGQRSRDLRLRLDLLGFGVDLHATCRWAWVFGDGARLVTAEPGGRWPDRSVEHVYRSAGEREVQVRARWTARFTVDGLGPFDVRDAVEQEAALPVAVGEGRAVLVR